MKNLIKLFSLNIFVLMLLASCDQGSNLALQEGEKEVNGGYGFTNQEGENGAEIYTCTCGHEWEDHDAKGDGSGEKGKCSTCGCRNYKMDESKIVDCIKCDHKYKDHNSNGGSCKRCSCKEYDDGIDFEHI